MSDRPRSILGLAVRLAWLRRRIVLLGALLLGLTVGIAAGPWRSPARVAVATFNIEMLPKHPGQAAAAMQVIRELDVPVVAIQEIMDRDMFAIAVPYYIGSDWRTVVSEGDESFSLGVAFDGDEYTLESSHTHHELRLDSNQRPALEVRLRPDRGPTLRMFVIHLKALGEPADIEMRRRQLQRLTPIVAASMASDDDVVVLGDFNATSEEDRRRLAEFAAATGLIWASEPLECTAFWQPEGKGCQTSRLDHVFTRRSPTSITAHGPCETDGCSSRDRCPAFHTWVSDHCPVVAEF